MLRREPDAHGGATVRSSGTTGLDERVCLSTSLALEHDSDIDGHIYDIEFGSPVCRGLLVASATCVGHEFHSKGGSRTVRCCTRQIQLLRNTCAAARPRSTRESTPIVRHGPERWQGHRTSVPHRALVTDMPYNRAPQRVLPSANERCAVADGQGIR